MILQLSRNGTIAIRDRTAGGAGTFKGPVKVDFAVQVRVSGMAALPDFAAAA